MYVRILSAMQAPVKVFGWSDPEHAFTNITSHGEALWALHPANAGMTLTA